MNRHLSYGPLSRTDLKELETGLIDLKNRAKIVRFETNLLF